MDKQEVVLVSQLLNAMYEAAMRLEEAYKRQDIESLERIKKEILILQRKIDEVL